MTQPNNDATTMVLPTSDHRDPLMRWLAEFQQSYGWRTRGSQELEAVEKHLYRLAKCLDVGVRVASDTEIDPGSLHLPPNVQLVGAAGDDEASFAQRDTTIVEPPTPVTVAEGTEATESADLKDLRQHATDLFEVYGAIPSRSRRSTAVRAATLAQAIGAYARGNAEGPELWATVERQEQEAFDRRQAFEAAVAAWHNERAQAV